jgi:hypothetical protein
MFEVREISPPRAPGIGDRGNSHAEGEAVGINAVISGKGSSLARPRIDMNVNVDEPGRLRQEYEVPMHNNYSQYRRKMIKLVSTQRQTKARRMAIFR